MVSADPPGQYLMIYQLARTGIILRKNRNLCSGLSNMICIVKEYRGVDGYRRHDFVYDGVFAVRRHEISVLQGSMCTDLSNWMIQAVVRGLRFALSVQMIFVG